MIAGAIESKINLSSGILEGATPVERFLRDLEGSFVDLASYRTAVLEGNPLLYAVSSVSLPQGSGQLHYGLGKLMPGKIGREYYLTKGHFHARREAAEVYIGLGGKGLMLLEDEGGSSRVLPLEENKIVYVPGFTAHRTINTGTEPLVYLGVYPADAGHDYGSIAVNNFRKVVIERNGKPVMIDRAEYKA